MLGCISLRLPSKRRTLIVNTHGSPEPQLQPSDDNACRSRKRGNCSNALVKCVQLAQQEHQRLLCCLHKEICDVHTSALEGRMSAVVDVISSSLSAATVRLYGVSGGPSTDEVAGLVLIAAAERPVIAGQSPNTFSEGSRGVRIPSGGAVAVSEYPGACCQDEASSLLRRAVATKEPVMFKTSPCCAVHSSNQHPAVAHRTTVAALPLFCAGHVLGAISVTADEAAVPAAHDLLSHSDSLQQLSLAISGVLMGAAAVEGGKLPYSCWLAGVVRRLTAAATLHALVVELTAALEDHVQRLYLLDVAVHVALVPAADSDVAYFLSQEAFSLPQHSSTVIICSSSGPGNRQDGHGNERTETDILMQLPHAMASGSVHGKQHGGSRVAMMALNGSSAANDVKATGLTPTHNLGGGGAQPSKGAPRPVAELRKRPHSAGNDCQVLGATTPQRRSWLLEQGPSAKCLGPDTLLVKMASILSADSISTNLYESPGSSIHVDASVSPPAASLRAKAIAMPYTLLQSVMKTTGSVADVAAIPKGAARDFEGLSAGVVVTSCKRWITDMRRPSRDVCLIMGGGGGSGLQPSAPKKSETTTAAAAQSLVLLGVPIRPIGNLAGGDEMFLGLYVAFPSSLPPQLLDAVRGSCRGLLQWSLACILRDKLQGPLIPEVEALREGVPGHYTVLVPLLVAAATEPTTIADHGALGTTEAVTTSRREQAQDVMGSLGAPTIHGNIFSPHLAGEVLPPGRLARTVTFAQSDASKIIITGSGPLVPNNGTDHSISVIALGSTVAGGGTFETASDVQLTIELGGRPARATTSTGAAGSNSGVPPPTLAPNRPPRGGSWRSLEANWKRKGAVTPQQPPQQPASSASQQQAAVGRRPSDISNDTSSSGRPPTAPSGLLFDTIDAAAELQASGCEAVMNGSGSQVVPAAATMLTVQQADGEDGMLRAHMSLIVDSLLDSMRSAAAVTETSSNNALMQTINTSFYDTTATRQLSTAQHGPVVNAVEDLLDDLQLYDVLGEGASGIVIRGLLGTVPVAVKLIEMPTLAEGGQSPQEAQGDTQKKAATNTVPVADIASSMSGIAPQRITKEVLTARQCLYRNAMELAVLKSTTHVNIVQCLDVYDNVVIDEHVLSGSDERFSILRRFKAQDTASADTPVCTAIVTELCDSSLSDELANLTFPTQLKDSGNRGKSSRSRALGVGPFKYDMRGIWLTVLDIALALRHLHARRLVHRDLKPANILLKWSCDDPRGWKTKLADFGFALLLEREGLPAAVVGTSAGSVRSNNGSIACTRTAPGLPTVNDAPPIGMTGSYNGTVRHPLAGLLTTGGGSSDPRASLDRGAGAFYTIQEQACGTVTHMAPEAMHPNTRIDASVDVFSLGIIMWELIAGRGQRPYRHLRPNDIPDAVRTGMRPFFPAWAPLVYRDLAQACWASNPGSRPSATEVVLVVKEQLRRGCYDPLVGSH